MEEDDPDRLHIREKISNMSFEELANLKKELGGQAYNEAVFGIRKKHVIQRRLNKNRPTEVSSKIRPKFIARNLTSASSSTYVPRDPRFDHLSGEYNAKKFKKDYSFTKDIRSREKEQLKMQLKEEDNEAQKKKIKFLITRMENQEREEKRLNQQNEKKQQELEEHVQMLREGRKPHYKTKAEKRVLDLVQEYEDLKKRGKVEKVIEKYRQKKKKQDRKKFPSM